MTVFLHKSCVASLQVKKLEAKIAHDKALAWAEASGLVCVFSGHDVQVVLFSAVQERAEHKHMGY